MHIRWVTWWPAPYWVDRFNFLTTIKGIDFEAIFLASDSAVQDWRLDLNACKFRYKILSQKRDQSGYFRPKLGIPNPFPLLKGKFDVLIMTYADISCIAAALICIAMKKPYYLFVANNKYDLRTRAKKKEWLKKFLFRRASGILATGPHQKEYALQYVDDETKVFIIGNPSQKLETLDVHTPPPLREKLGLDSKRIVLLYVGRLSQEKGLMTLINALEINGKRGLRPYLILVGSGTFQKHLESEVTKRGLEVKFLGFLAPNDLIECYSTADIFILPSLSEPWGLVVNEAMEFGLPLILSNHVGSSPVLLKDKENGFLFSAGNVQELSNCIELLCSNEVLRREMGQCSKEMIKKHTIQNWADSVLNALKRQQSKWH